MFDLIDSEGINENIQEVQDLGLFFQKYDHMDNWMADVTSEGVNEYV